MGYYEVHWVANASWLMLPKGTEVSAVAEALRPAHPSGQYDMAILWQGSMHANESILAALVAPHQW